jgi:hypothetical protein
VAPLLRATLLVFARDEHVLITVTHHLITDARAREILERVRCRQVLGTAPPEPAPRYLDYARAQQRERVSPAAAAQLRWWLGALASVEPLALGPRQPEEGVGVHRMVYDAGLRERLDQRASRLGVTRFAFLLTVVGEALGRWAGRDQLVITTDLNNRGSREFAEVVGLMADVLPVLIDRRDVRIFEQLLARVCDFMASALARQSVSFADILDALRPGSLPSYDRLFPVAFFVEEERASLVSSPGLVVRSHELDSPKISRALYVIADVSGAQMTLAFHHRRCDLPDERVAELAQRVDAALRRALGEPHESSAAEQGSNSWSE